MVKKFHCMITINKVTLRRLPGSQQMPVRKSGFYMIQASVLPERCVYECVYFDGCNCKVQS